MRGGTASKRNSGATDSALPTSRPGPQPQQGQTPLLFRRPGVGSSRAVEKTPLVRLQARAGCSGNAKSLLPQRREEMLVKVSRCDQSEGRRIKTRAGGLSFKTPHLQRFGLKIECRDAKSSAIQSLSCCFCFWFGREPQPGLAAAVSGKLRST
jgi:hypothetical protein